MESISSTTVFENISLLFREMDVSSKPHTKLIVTNPQKVLTLLDPSRAYTLQELRSVLFFSHHYCGFSTEIYGYHLAGKFGNRMILLTYDYNFQDLDLRTNPSMHNLYSRLPELEFRKREEMCIDTLIELTLKEVEGCALFTHILRDHENISGTQLLQALVFKYSYGDVLESCEETTDHYAIGKYGDYTVSLTKDLCFERTR